MKKDMTLTSAAPGRPYQPAPDAERRRPERPRGWFGVLKSAFLAWQEDDVPHLGAALAYYTVFSIAPLLVVAIGIAGQVFGREAVEGQVLLALSTYVGEGPARTIQDALVEMRLSGQGPLMTAVGAGMLIFGASGVFAALKASLNKIWKVAPRPGGGMMGFLRGNYSRVMLVGGTAFLMIASMLLSTLLSTLGHWFADVLPGGELVWQIGNVLIALAVISLTFGAVFKIVPDVEIAWSDALRGGAVTALLFTLGQFLIGFYLGRTALASVFGAAGSLIVLLIWVYYTSQIFFFGAEYTRAYAALRGHGIQPDANALAIPPGPEGVPGTDRMEPPKPEEPSPGRTQPRPT